MGTRATLEQRARQFDPTVIPIQAGTEISFPHSDDVRHHVYSFLRPNAFRLKLYHGEPSEPVLIYGPDQGCLDADATLPRATSG